MGLPFTLAQNPYVLIEINDRSFLRQYSHPEKWCRELYLDFHSKLYTHIRVRRKRLPKEDYEFPLEVFWEISTSLGMGVYALGLCSRHYQITHSQMFTHCKNMRDDPHAPLSVWRPRIKMVVSYDDRINIASIMHKLWNKNPETGFDFIIRDEYERKAEKIVTNACERMVKAFGTNYNPFKQED